MIQKYEIWILCIMYYTVFYRIFKIRVFCICQPWFSNLEGQYLELYIKIKRGTNHRHKKHRQTGDTTLKKGGSQLNYLDLTQTMARKLGR